MQEELLEPHPQLLINFLVYKCLTQLARLTWWTRHSKTPEINLENYISQSAEVTSTKAENDLTSIPQKNGDLLHKQCGGMLPIFSQSYVFIYIRFSGSIKARKNSPNLEMECLLTSWDPHMLNHFVSADITSMLQGSPSIPQPISVLALISHREISRR